MNSRYPRNEKYAKFQAKVLLKELKKNNLKATLKDAQLEYCKKFNFDNWQHFIRTIKKNESRISKKTNLKPDIVSDSFDQAEVNFPGFEKVSQKRFYELADKYVDAKSLEDSIETEVCDQAFLEAEALLSVYIAETRQVFQDEPDILSYSYYIGKDSGFVLLKAKMESTITEKSTMGSDEFSLLINPTVELRLNIYFFDDNEYQLDWEPNEY